jgi:hypothetical protein
VEAITYGIVAGVFFLVDKIREKRAEEERARAASALPDPPHFTPAQINKFTRVDGPVRVFDNDVTEKTLELLGSRSVVPVTSDPFLAQTGKVWRVIPLTPGIPRALDVVTDAHASKDKGVVVLGSFSLVLLPNASQAPMVIVVGGPNAQILAVREDAQQPGGKFALLRPASAKVAAAAVPSPTATAAATVTAMPDAPGAAESRPSPATPKPVSALQAAELGRIVATLKEYETRAPQTAPADKQPVSNGIRKEEASLIAEAVVSEEP